MIALWWPIVMVMNTIASRSLSYTIMNESLQNFYGVPCHSHIHNTVLETLLTFKKIYIW